MRTSTLRSKHRCTNLMPAKAVRAAPNQADSPPAAISTLLTAGPRLLGQTGDLGQSRVTPAHRVRFRPSGRLSTMGPPFGIATGLVGVAVTGGWYEYRTIKGAVERRDAINEEGWHVVPGQEDDAYLRRQRIRLGR